MALKFKVLRGKNFNLNFGAKKIKPADIAIFTRQLATMMKAGVPLVQAFDIVAEGTDHEKMRELIMTVRTDVFSGTGLAGDLANTSPLDSRPFRSVPLQTNTVFSAAISSLT